MVGVYVSFFIAYVTLYFCGYPVKVLLLNEDLKKYDLYITPWLGIGVVITAFFPLSWLGVSVERSAGYVAIAIVLCAAAVYLKFRETVRVSWREVVLISFVGFVTASIYGGILFAHDFEIYSVAVTADYASYLNDAKNALFSSAAHLAARPPGAQAAETALLSLVLDFRGCVFVPAFFAALFKTELHRIMYMLSAFVMFLNVITFRLFLKRMENILAACLIIGILCFNTFYQTMVFYAFTGQLYSVGIVLTAFYMEYYLASRDRFDPRTCLLLVFVISFNGLNYIEAFAFPAVPMAAFFLAAGWRRDAGARAFRRNALFTGLVGALINIPVIVNFFKVFFMLDQTPPAWATHMATFFDVAGLQGVSANPDVQFVMLIVSNVILAAAILYQMRREGPGSFLPVAAASYFALHAAFCLRYFRYGEPSSYSAFKSALSLSFIAVIMLLRFLEERLGVFLDAVSGVRKSGPAGLNALPSKRGFAAAALFSACFAANAYAAVKSVRGFIELPAGSIGREHDALAPFASSPSYDDSDFIICAESIPGQWTAEYYAPGERTYVTGLSGVGRDASGPMMRDFFKPGDIYIAVTEAEEFSNTTDAEPVMVNGVYSVFHMGGDSLLLYGCGGMSVNTDIKRTPDGAPVLARRVTDGRASLRIRALRDKATSFDVTFFREDEDMAGSVRAYVNGVFASSFPSAGRSVEANMDGIALRGGVNEISFEFDGDISDVFAVGPKFR
ncbi:MAG: hypothetical protein LBS53_14255 [Synergistaceae bacterium]|jgi:hypothetical protein|nr:hypothetical protein [Synergistaceae bacterium]